MKAKQLISSPRFFSHHIPITGLIFIILLSPYSIFAGTTGKISGRVVDSGTGGALPNANVIVHPQIINGKEIPLDMPIWK